MTNKVVKIGSFISGIDPKDARHPMMEFLEQCTLGSIVTELSIIGDKSQDLSLEPNENNNVRIEAMEEALLRNEIDVAIYEMYEAPISIHDGLCLAAVSNRTDSNEVLLVSKNGLADEEELSLKKGAIIGTSSLCRLAQILYLKPDVICKDFNANISIGLDKMATGDYDAIIVSKTKLADTDLDLKDVTQINLHPAEFVPTPCQGVYVYQCRKDDIELRKILLNIHHSDVADCTNVERKVLKLMDVMHRQKLGVHCQKDKNGNFHVYGAYAPEADMPLIKVKKSQSTVYNLAEEVVKELIIFKKTT